MINLKGYNFLFGKKAVSPVIGTILMVAVTVIMAAIVGGFVYQTARPKVPPAMSSSLADDPRQAVGGAGDQRIAKLSWEGGKNLLLTEVRALVTYTDNASAEQTVVQNATSWSEASGGAPMDTNKIELQWVDSDGSDDISPGDRLDFYEGTAATAVVKANRDFTVKIIHIPTEALVADYTIRVY
ncbi:MAG: type IV pilin N-terminal domain-containing protein [Chloroflexi bacterium]|nr:type IV pilin N-terminal domain-containing protein [Chloroflexota bacterium]